MATMLPELGSKRLELLKEAVPRVARRGRPLDPASDLELRATRTAAYKLGLPSSLLEVRNAGRPGPRVSQSSRKERPDALTMLFDLR